MFQIPDPPDHDEHLRHEEGLRRLMAELATATVPQKPLQHPVHILGRLDEAHDELERRIHFRAVQESIESQLERVREIRLDLEMSMAHYNEAILLDDLKRSINARIDAKQAEKRNCGQAGSGV